MLLTWTEVPCSPLLNFLYWKLHNTFITDFPGLCTVIHCLPYTASMTPSAFQFRTTWETLKYCLLNSSVNLRSSSTALGISVFILKAYLPVCLRKYRIYLKGSDNQFNLLFSPKCHKHGFHKVILICC